MPSILTLDYTYLPQDQAWFTKRFTSYADLLKWLREDSVVILPGTLLRDEKLKKSLILTKLALPKVKILILDGKPEQANPHFFKITDEENLEEIIKLTIINSHKIIDNRENLQEVIRIYL